MKTLWHYTCDHAQDSIGDEGLLVPALAQIGAAAAGRMPSWEKAVAGLVWLTDLDSPLRNELGLTSNSIGCDRTRHRYRVVGYSAVHYPTIRRDLPKRAREALESAEGAMPMHWFVAYTPVPVVYDPILEVVPS